MILDENTGQEFPPQYKGIWDYKVAVLKDIIQAMKTANRPHGKTELVNMLKSGFSDYQLPISDVRGMFDNLVERQVFVPNGKKWDIGMEGYALLKIETKYQTYIPDETIENRHGMYFIYKKNSGSVHLFDPNHFLRHTGIECLCCTLKWFLLDENVITTTVQPFGVPVCSRCCNILGNILHHNKGDMEKYQSQRMEQYFDILSRRQWSKSSLLEDWIQRAKNNISSEEIWDLSHR